LISLLNESDKTYYEANSNFFKQELEASNIV